MKFLEISKILENGLVKIYNNTPSGKYITIVIKREAQSEVIFRTEGSGQGCNKEYVKLGMINNKVAPRAVISKRKQAAVERRTGREILRLNGVLGECTLNNNKPCGKCIDCMSYGFAVGGGGAQKSRVIYDNAYSINEFDEITDVKTFNAIYENGTMRDENGKASSSINEDEYIKVGTVFLDMVTLKDITLEEFIYVVGAILRSKRYGAISSKIGKMKNEILGILVSDCEVFSNNELTQKVYDKLVKDNILESPISETALENFVQESMAELCKDIFGVVKIVENKDKDLIINEIKNIMQDEAKLKEILNKQTKAYEDK